MLWDDRQWNYKLNHCCINVYLHLFIIWSKDVKRGTECTMMCCQQGPLVLIEASSSSSSRADRSRNYVFSALLNAASRCLCKPNFAVLLEHLFLRSKFNLGCFFSSKAHDHPVILMILYFSFFFLHLACVPVTGAVVRGSAEFRQIFFFFSFWSRMYSVHQFLAIFLAVGCTSDLCCAGPLHAQCKVEWWASFLLYSLWQKT